VSIEPSSPTAAPGRKGAAIRRPPRSADVAREPDLRLAEVAQLLARAVGREADPLVERAAARVGLEHPERHARPAVARQAGDGRFEQGRAGAAAPRVRIDVERRDLRRAGIGVAVARRRGEPAEADDRAGALGDERARTGSGSGEALAPGPLAAVDRQAVEDAVVDDAAVARLPAADVDRRDRARVGEDGVADEDAAGADQAPDSSQSPRLVNPTITTSM
jgi:hypothetical protein